MLPWTPWRSECASRRRGWGADGGRRCEGERVSERGWESHVAHVAPYIVTLRVPGRLRFRQGQPENKTLPICFLPAYYLLPPSHQQQLVGLCVICRFQYTARIQLSRASLTTARSPSRVVSHNHSVEALALRDSRYEHRSIVFLLRTLPLLEACPVFMVRLYLECRSRMTLAVVC